MKSTKNLHQQEIVNLEKDDTNDFSVASDVEKLMTESGSEELKQTYWAREEIYRLNEKFKHEEEKSRIAKRNFDKFYEFRVKDDYDSDDSHF